MKKIFILLIINISLLASTSILNVKYESGISIYGKIGFVDLTLKKNLQEKTYMMQAITTSHGVVKYLSDNRIDTFTSEGKIKNGVYIPLKFTKKTTKTDVNKTTVYDFDYENNTVLKTKTVSEYKIISTFNPIEFGFNDVRTLFVDKKSENIDLEPNDYLSLYLNLKHGNLKKGKVPYVDKKDKDTLLFLGNNLFEVQKNFGDDSYQISMIDDNESIFFQKVMSIGVAFYGDAYIEKISESSSIQE